MARSSLNFDNIMKVFKTQIAITGVTLVTKELDFDIPRGYIVKIHDVQLEIRDLIEDIEGISADKAIRIVCALVKDPDDLTSIRVPNDTVSHDVLMDHQVDILIVANAADTSLSMYVSNQLKERNFSAEGLDVFTARNLRLNVDVFGSDAADVTEALCEAVIHYTLEKITDNLIINLLDIL